MNEGQISSNQSGIKPHMVPNTSPQTYKGIYHSNTINKAPSEVYAFCQNEANLNQVLSNLPEKIENFLNLQFVGGYSLNDGMFKVEWKNKEKSDVSGHLILFISPRTIGEGSVVIANALFGEYRMENDGASDLINIFLKRMKALVETGQLATIKGQPNGKDEDEIIKSGTIQH